MRSCSRWVRKMIAITAVSVGDEEGASNQTVQDAAERGAINPASMQSQSGRSFQCLQAGIRDRDASDLGRVAADSQDLALHRRKPVVHQVEQFGREARKK